LSYGEKNIILLTGRGLVGGGGGGGGSENILFIHSHHEDIHYLAP
jgi:hypothetical protein